MYTYLYTHMCIYIYVTFICIYTHMCIYIYVTFICIYIYIYTYTVYALVQVSACSHHLSFSATLPFLCVPESIEALNHFRISEAARSKARRFLFQLYLATSPLPYLRLSSFPRFTWQQPRGILPDPLEKTCCLFGMLSAISSPLQVLS